VAQGEGPEFKPQYRQKKKKSIIFKIDPLILSFSFILSPSFWGFCCLCSPVWSVIKIYLPSIQFFNIQNSMNILSNTSYSHLMNAMTTLIFPEILRAVFWKIICITHHFHTAFILFYFVLHLSNQ
jgi:hypothetical protein